MAKPKVSFICNECGHVYPKWVGRCTECGEWSSVTEQVDLPRAKVKSGRTLRINNPLGGMYHTEEYLKKNFATNVRVKNAILYQTYAHFAKIKPRQKDFKLLLALTKIPSYILFLNWKKKYGK